MKKFSKILFLLLSVVAIVAAFTVVALATETPEPYEYPYYDSTFSNYDVGKELSYGRDAYAVITVQDNGNKYVLAKDNPNSTASNSQWDISYQDYISTDYNLIDYPYFMLDFDIMTLSGSYSGHSWVPRLYNDKSDLSFLGAGIKFSTGLSTKPYDWSHVSLIVQYKGSSNFTVYYYVNGEKVSSYDATKANVTSAIEKTTRVSSMKLYPQTSCEVGYDNMKFTYFPAGYEGGDITAIANYNYSKYGVVDGYEFPFGETVATLTDNETGEKTYFDDSDEAFAAAKANPNSTLELAFAATMEVGGKKTYVTEDEFATKFNAMPDGAKMTLYQDMVLYSALTFNEGRTTELDLNGHKIYRLGTEYTDYRAVLNEDGTYGKGEALTSPAAVAGGYLFTMAKQNTTFTLSSSAPGAKIYSATIAAERLLLEDGTVVGSVSALIPTAKPEQGYHYKEIFNIASDNISLTIKGDITTFSDSLIMANTATNFKLHINGGTYVKALRHTNGLLYFDKGGTIILENATFSSGGYLYRHYPTGNPSTVTINNCTIIGGYIQSNDTAGKCTITNSRLYGITSITVAGSCLAGEGTWFDKEYTAIGKLENNTLIQKTKKVACTLPNRTLNIDPVTLLPYDTSYDTTLTYSYVALNESTDFTTVTWLDHNGKTVATTKEVKDGTPNAPTNVKIPMPNGYGAFTNPYWLDENGNKSDLKLGNLDSYTFKASTEVPEEPKLVAYVDEVLFNLTYSDMFVYRLYVPVVEGIAITLLGAYGPEGNGSQNFKKYMINGKEYYGCVAAWNAVATAVENTPGRIKYTLNGVTYTYDLQISALLYANLLCGDTTGNIQQIEKNAMFDMMAYLEQIYALAGKLTDHQDKFDTFFATHYEKGNGKARPAFDANTQTVYEINNDFKKYVASTQYALHKDARLSFGVTLKVGAYDEENPEALLESYLDYTVTSDLSNFGYKIVATTDATTGEPTSYTYHCYNNGYTTVMKNDYLIKVKDASGKVVATQSYNLATYRAGLVEALAKNPEAANANELQSAINLVDSIYTFGNAINEVWAYLNKL